jgi:hypothetical protein
VSTPAYKVLGPNGESIHGGSLSWSLPTVNEAGEWTPGEWHEVKGKVRCCSNGLHLTTAPVMWWRLDARVFLVEHEGDADTDGSADDKFAVRRARLIREELDWAGFGVFSSGEHSVSSGFVRASDSATVRASGSATVEASGSATVEASGSATVRASDSATVVRTPWHRAKGWVSLADFAAVVDRRNGGTPALYAAPWSDKPEASNG